MYPIMETERLRLIPMKDSDLADMFRLDSDPAVYSTMENDVPDDLEAYKHGFSQAVKNGEYLTLRNKKTGNFIGYIAIHQYLRHLKIAYSQMWTAILPEYRNCGYCTEAAGKLLHFAFTGIKTPVVYANQFHTNPAAGKVLQKCGMRFYRTLEMQNRPYDQYRYKIAEYTADKNISGESEYDYTFSAGISPYSYENPVRKIDSVMYIKEPTGYLCGQSVIAMLAGVSVDEVIGVMRTDKGTSVGMINSALKYYGIKTATKSRVKYSGDTAFPDCCILSVQLPGYGHWSLYYKGKFYDPEFGVLDSLPEKAKICYYREIIL